MKLLTRKRAAVLFPLVGVATLLTPTAALAASGVVAPRASACETRSVSTPSILITSPYYAKIKATMSWCWNKTRVYGVNPGYWEVTSGRADVVQLSSQTQYYNFNGTSDSGYMVLRYFKACAPTGTPAGGTTCEYPNIRIYVHRDGGVNWYTNP